MDIRKQINFFPFYDLRGMEQHLSDMAGKGWRIEKPGTLLWTYRRDEPRKAVFGICTAGELDAYKPGCQEDPESFQDQAKKKGWTMEAKSQQMQIYSAEADAKLSLHADPYDRITGITQAAKPWFLLYGIFIFMAAASLILTGYKMKVMPVGLYSSSFGMAIPIILLMLGIYFIYSMISYFHWKTNAEIEATKKKIGEVSFHTDGLLKGILLISLGLLGFAAVTSGESPVARTFFTWAVVLAALFAVFKLVHDLLGKQKENSSGILVGILNVVVALCLVAAVLLAMNSIRAADRGSDAILTFTAQDLGLAEEKDDVQDLGRSKQSFLLRHSEATQMTPNEDGQYAPILSYEMVDSRMLSVDGRILKHFLDRMDLTGENPENGETVKVEYVPMDSAPWGALKAWQMTQNGKPGSVYLVLYEGRILELGAPEQLTEAQMQVVGDRVS